MCWWRTSGFGQEHLTTVTWSYWNPISKLLSDAFPHFIKKKIKIKNCEQYSLISYAFFSAIQSIPSAAWQNHPSSRLVCFLGQEYFSIFQYHFTMFFALWHFVELFDMLLPVPNEHGCKGRCISDWLPLPALAGNSCYEGMRPMTWVLGYFVFPRKVPAFKTSHQPC